MPAPLILSFFLAFLGLRRDNDHHASDLERSPLDSISPTPPLVDSDEQDHPTRDQPQRNDSTNLQMPPRQPGYPLGERTTTQMSSATGSSALRWFDRTLSFDAEDSEQQRIPPQRKRTGIRVGRTWTTFSALSTDSSKRDEDDNKPPGRLSTWWTNVKDFVLQDGVYDKEPYVPNYRWTPIFSGVVIPFAILLEIPGLTGHWYVRTEANRTVEVQRNPEWLIASVSISMACGIIANIALVRRFLEHQARMMTLIAIVTLTIHDVINAVCCTVFAIQRRFDDGFTYGQPFWMTVTSTSVALFTNVTLIYDYLTTSDFAKHGSGLTRKQRSLVIVVIILLCWISFGAVVYSSLMKLSYIDGLYFTVVSIETIGFGDFHPTTTRGRIFSIFYNTVGILNLGMAISTCRETVIESFQHSYRKRLQSLADHRIKKREKKIRKTVIVNTLREAGLPVYITPHLENERYSGGRGGGGYKRRAKQVLNVDALSSEDLKHVEEETEEMIKQDRLSHNRSGANVYLLREWGNLDEMKEDLTSFGGTRRMLEFLGEGSHSSLLDKEQNREFVVKLTVAWSLFLLFWLIGGVIFMQTERWSYGVALYFCFITFSTIGYGDFAPLTLAGRSIFIVWALLGVGTMTILISVLAEAYSSKYSSVLRTQNFDRAVKNYRKRESIAFREETDRPVTDSSDIAPGDSANSGPPLEKDRSSPGTSELANELLVHAMTLQSHALYILGTQSHHPPESLLRLLDDIAVADGIGTKEDGQNMIKAKKEVLGDEGARKLLFMVSFENSMRKMLHAVEAALHPHRHRHSPDSLTATTATKEQTPRTLFTQEEVEEPENIEAADEAEAQGEDEAIVDKFDARTK